MSLTSQHKRQKTTPRFSTSTSSYVPPDTIDFTPFLSNPLQDDNQKLLLSQKLHTDSTTDLQNTAITPHSTQTTHSTSNTQTLPPPLVIPYSHLLPLSLHLPQNYEIVFLQPCPTTTSMIAAIVRVDENGPVSTDLGGHFDDDGHHHQGSSRLNRNNHNDSPNYTPTYSNPTLHSDYRSEIDRITSNNKLISTVVLLSPPIRAARPKSSLSLSLPNGSI